MKTARLVAISTLVALLIAVAIGAMLRRGFNPQSQPLPDGTVLSLVDAKIGLTNVFVRGSLAQRLLGNLIPTNGLRFGRFDLERAEREIQGWGGVPALSFEFQLTGASNNLAASQLFGRRAFYRQFRIVHWGDDGFHFVEEAPDRNFKRRRAGWFGYVTTETFCRSGKTLHLEIQEHDRSDDNNWRTIAKFTIPHPAPRAPEKWKTEKFPVTMRSGPLSATLGEVKVQWPRDGVTRYPDIWQHLVYFPFRFFWNGQSVTNWTVAETGVRDASGNSTFMGTMESFTNGWVLYSGWRSATPTVPWRISGHLTESSGFPSSNIFMLHIPLPLSGTLKTNLGGIPASVELNDGEFLDVQIPTNLVSFRILLLGITDQSGNSIDALTGSWGQHRFFRRLELRNRVSKIHAKVAIAPDVPFEFTVQPVLMRDISPPPPVEVSQ